MRRGRGPRISPTRLRPRKPERASARARVGERFRPGVSLTFDGVERPRRAVPDDAAVPGQAAAPASALVRGKELDGRAGSPSPECFCLRLCPRHVLVRHGADLPRTPPGCCGASLNPRRSRRRAGASRCRPGRPASPGAPRIPLPATAADRSAGRSRSRPRA